MSDINNFYQAIDRYVGAYRNNESKKDIERLEKEIFDITSNIKLKYTNVYDIHSDLFNIPLEYKKLLNIMISFRKKTKLRTTL